MNLSQGYVESNVRLGPNIHACADSEEIMRVEQIALKDEGVKAEVAKLRIPEGSVVICDPWIYGKFYFYHECLISLLTDMSRLGWYR